MGMIYNHVTLVYDCGEQLQDFRNMAIEIFKPLIDEHVGNIETDGEFVSEVFTSLTNGEEFFIVNTDGSKSGWDTNNRFQRARKEFVDYCEANGVVQIATIEFGDNDSPTLTSY